MRTCNCATSSWSLGRRSNRATVRTPRRTRRAVVSTTRRTKPRRRRRRISRARPPRPPHHRARPRSRRATMPSAAANRQPRRVPISAPRLRLCRRLRPRFPRATAAGRLSRGRPSPAGFSSRRSLPPWPRSSRFSSSPSRAPNALARVRNDDADDRSRRTRRSPRRFLVEVEVANAPRHHSPPSTSKPRETYRETPLSLGVLRERPRRVHEPRLDRPRPRESSNARSRGPDPARRFHRRRPRWAARRDPDEPPSPRGCETRRTRTISRFRTNPATTAAISAARRAGIRSAA